MASIKKLELENAMFRRNNMRLVKKNAQLQAELEKLKPRVFEDGFYFVKHIPASRVTIAEFSEKHWFHIGDGGFYSEPPYWVGSKIELEEPCEKK